MKECYVCRELVDPDVDVFARRILEPDEPDEEAEVVYICSACRRMDRVFNDATK